MKRNRIELNPRVCNGRPVIRGTRITVSVILEQIAEGISWDTLLADYPELEKEDIKLLIPFLDAYSSEQIEDNLVILSPKRGKWVRTS
jgi:uncharacterized protein (DUF433 family)